MKKRDNKGRYIIGFDHNGFCEICKTNFNKKREAQLFCSRRCAGIDRARKRPDLKLKYNTRIDKGIKRPDVIIDSELCSLRAKKQWLNPDYRKKQTKSHIGKIGPLASNWRGGISQYSSMFRQSGEYKRWKKAIFKRDGRKCVLCGSIKEPLHVDHIKSFSKYPELRINLENGRVLCWECHKKTESYGCCKKEIYEESYQTI